MLIRRLARSLPVAVVVFSLAATWAFASSGSTTDEGTIHTGVGSQEEADSFPCPPGETGPVVCVPDRGTAWKLTTDATGDCTQGPVGWQGDCVFAFDAGDELRVWGTRGIPLRSFRITWTVASGGAREPPPAPGSGDGTADAHQAGPAVPGVERPQVADPAPRPAPDPPSASTRTAFQSVAADAPSASEQSAAARRNEVPEAAFWDPPVTEVPGFSDLTAMPPPTFAGVANGGRPQDAGAPAAAGAIALLAAVWVIWSRRDSPSLHRHLSRREGHELGDA